MKTIYSLLSMLLCMAFANAAFAQDGNLDTGFDTDGIATVVTDTTPAATDAAYFTAIQTDGKLLVCGNSVNGATSRFTLMRFEINGSLDNSFGTNGVLRGFIGASTNTTGIIVQSLGNGKILLAGSTTLGGEQRWFVTRLNSNGSTDTTFGINGVTTIDINPSGTVSQQLTDMKVRADGKIVLGGNYTTSINRNWYVVRLNEGGAQDSTFGTTGIFLVPGITGSLNEIALTPDQKILVTGRVAISGAWYPGIIRINDNATLDLSFSDDGVETYTITGLLASEAFGIDISPDRTIMLAGTARNTLAGNNNDNIFVLKVNANGGLNSAFGTGGIATFDPVGNLQDLGFQLKVLSNNKIVVAGASLRTTAASSRDMVVIRLNSNGSLDNSFGTLAGRTFIDGGSNSEDFGWHSFIRPNGKIVVVGQASVSGKIRAIVAQLNGTVAPQVVTSFIPEIKSISKTALLANSVSLSCTVNPGAISTSTVFQVSTSATFGSIVNSITTATGSGVSDTTVTSTIVGLSPGVPYYARAISSNINGNDTSATASFLFNNILPSDSLSLWLRSDVGITTSSGGNFITGWADLSPKENNVGIAPGISQPNIVNNSINGFPAVRFDGVNDFLTSTKNLDVRNGPSIFIVAKNAVRKDVNAFLKISATHTEINSHMDFYWQAGASGNGNLVYAANRPSSGFGGLAKARIYPNVGTANAYYLASCVVPSNINASGYFNGDSLTNSTDNGTGVFLAQGTSLAQIGVLPPTGSFLNGDLVEMIVYNRPLSQTERVQVELYLANRYNLSLGYTPSASLDTFTNLTATSITLRANVTPKSLGTNYAFEVSTSPNFTSPINSTTASLAPSATASLVTATISGLSSGTIYYYRAKLTNAAGTYYSNIGAFKHQIQIPSNGMRTWISADQAVETNNQKVTGIYDLAEPRRYTSADTATAPSLVTNVLNGKPVLRYDGSNDVLTGNLPLDLRTNLTTVIVFKNRVRKSYNGLFRIAAALTGETSNYEIFSDGTGTGNGLQFTSVNRASNALATLETSSSGNTFPVSNYYVWVEQKSQSGPVAGLRSINNTVITQTLGGNNQGLRTPNFINTPYIGIGYNGTAFAGNKYLDGDIAEVIAYNRVLTAQEISQLHAYLEQKYSLGILKPALSNLSVTKQGASNTFLASSFTIDNRGVSGSYQVQYSTNKFSTFDTLARQFYTSAQSSFTAQIPAPLKFTVYQVRVAASNAFGTDTLSREAMSPFANFNDSQILGWYRSDGGVVIGTTAGKVQRWINLRNYGSVSTDLEALFIQEQPSLQTNAINTHDALEFNGATTNLRSNALVNLGFFTISIVFKATGGLVYEHGTNTNFNDGSYLNSTNGNTIMIRRGFDRSTKNLAAGWATNNTYRIVTHVFTGSHASHNLYVNGQLMSMTNGPFTANPGASADATFFLGSRGSISDFMTGQIAEVIINNAQIASSELDSLHAYLSQRYNIALVTGLEQNELAEQALQLYPNPAKDALTLTIGDQSFTHARIEVYSLDGRMVQQHQLQDTGMGSTHSLSLEGLNAGTYMIIMHTDKGTMRRKLIKE